MSSPQTSSAVLSARRDAGAGLRLVTLSPAPEIARAYRAPGQYIDVRSPRGSGYFALAGELGAPAWEVLVRSNGDASDELVEAPLGTAFELSGPLGTGFPLERGHGRPLVVAVAGSALAVSRPILRHRCATGQAATTTVYIGAKTAQDVALASEVSAWARAGARVVLCLSRPEQDDPAALPEAQRRRGWVQRVIGEDIASLGVAAGEAPLLTFAAGPFGMLGDLRALATWPPGASPSMSPGAGPGGGDAATGAALELVTNI